MTSVYWVRKDLRIRSTFEGYQIEVDTSPESLVAYKFSNSDFKLVTLAFRTLQNRIVFTGTTSLDYELPELCKEDAINDTTHPHFWLSPLSIITVEFKTRPFINPEGRLYVRFFVEGLHATDMPAAEFIDIAKKLWQLLPHVCR
ncbi:unnamed protein product [Orchesella dallaii]|uniref:Uncharacterized protein n=1 Tax=Orchesella dallaii TaxID=48710 RepID=A0ABP1RS66_9HEXA